MSKRWPTLVWGITVCICSDLFASLPQPDDTKPVPTVAAKPNRKADAERAKAAAQASSEGQQAFAERRFHEAASLFERARHLRPGDFINSYNLACALSMAGNRPDAAKALLEAIEEGYCDRRGLDRDPAMRVLLNEPSVANVIAQWPRVIEARRDANAAQLEEVYSNGYVTSPDAALRLTYRSAFDSVAFAEAQAELSRLAHWADEGVLKGVLDGKASELDPWVSVVLPNSNDFTRWAVAKFGPDAMTGMSGIGGSYDHDSKQLVAMDLGSTLRHEFFHVLHWRSMDRLGQRHPIWVMEGLCSLVEDYDIGTDGKLIPATSWRTNVAKRMEKSGGMMPLPAFFELSQLRFTGSRPLANYAQGRALFLYLSDRNLLPAWYEAFTTGFDAESTGRAAFEKVCDKPIQEVEKDFRAWLRALPDVAEEIKTGMASLGLEVESGSGDGLRITGISRKRSEVKDLRLGDTITSVNHRPTRDMAELVRILGSLEPGELVHIGYRRGRLNGETELLLVTK